MKNRAFSRARHALGIAALAAAAFIEACGGGSDAPPTADAMAVGAESFTVTENAVPGPIQKPDPMANVGEQFAESATGVAYPKLDKLWTGAKDRTTTDGLKPVVTDGMVMPWLSDREPIRFRVYVESDHNTDGAKGPDLLALRIVQPAEVGEGLQTPVILLSTPYSDETKHPNHDDERLRPILGETEYLRRGFTVVYADSLGTNKSTGCPSIMDKMERDANASVVRWLAKDLTVRALDHTTRQPVLATWSTGHVAMEGLSYVGTTPILAAASADAATAVKGLEAIVSLAGIANAYDYFGRYDGVRPDEDWTPNLDEFAELRTPPIRHDQCAAALKLLREGVDDETLAFNEFWQKRDTRELLKNFKGATLIAQGQSDNNVKTRNTVGLYEALSKAGNPVQLWLHNRGHSPVSWQPEWHKQVLLWYTRYLFGVNNGVDTQPGYVHEMPAGDSRQLLVKEKSWPVTRTESYTLHHALSGVNGGKATLAAENELTADVPASPLTFSAYGDSGEFWAFAKRKETRYAGTIRLKLPATFSVAFATAPTNLKASLYVDNVKVTWGWANPRFYNGLKKAEKIEKGVEYMMKLDMMPRDFTVAPKSTVKIVLEGFPDGWKFGEPRPAVLADQQISIDLKRAALEMPLVPFAHIEAAMRLD